MALRDNIRYKEATILDIEADGLLDEATKIYIVGFKLYNQKNVKVFWGDTDEDRIKALFEWHVKTKTPIVMHNGTSYDKPLIEKLYCMDLSDLIVIDTLGLSWYLNIDKEKHGIEALSEDYNVGEKFFVDKKDWVTLSKEQAEKRVTQDVILNEAIWIDFMERLEYMYSESKQVLDRGEVGGKREEGEVLYIDSLTNIPVESHVSRLIDYVCIKKECQALAEKTQWQVDIPYLEEHISILEQKVEALSKELEGIMPPVAQYSDRKEPAEKWKKNGELSVSGKKWDSLTKRLDAGEEDEWGNPLVKVRKDGYISEITSYKQPNINSSTQVKDFLYSHGWRPSSFKYVRDKEAMNEWGARKPKQGANRNQWEIWKNSKPEERAIPQIRVDGKEGKELCESVSELAEKIPEVKTLEEYSVIKHRLDTMKGILTRTDKDGKVEASSHGFTNTMRFKHRAPLVNLPGANRKYAEPIRGCLIAPDGYVSLGTDLSSLEDRIKHHYMIPHDPLYVETMMGETYDPHLTVAVKAGMVTQEQADKYIEGLLEGDEKVFVSAMRHIGKQTGYASVYGAGPAKIAQTAGITLEEAEVAHKGYWDLNWSVKTISSEQKVIKDKKGKEWLINPINGLLYNVRGEKDYFSTLVQGSGAFLFDMWLWNFLLLQKKKWNCVSLTGQMHDEFIVVIKDTEKFRELFKTMIVESLLEVNKEYRLRRSLGCEIQFGKRYSEIH